jgi:hypothetical protein
MRSRTLLCWASKVPTKVSPTRPSSAHTTLYGALLLAALEHPDAVVAAPQLGWVRDPQPQPAAAGPIALRVQQPAEALLEACDLGGRCLRSRAVLGWHGHGSIDRLVLGRGTRREWRVRNRRARSDNPAGSSRMCIARIARTPPSIGPEGHEPTPTG